MDSDKVSNIIMEDIGYINAKYHELEERIYKTLKPHLSDDVKEIYQRKFVGVDSLLCTIEDDDLALDLMFQIRDLSREAYKLRLRAIREYLLEDQGHYHALQQHE